MTCQLAIFADMTHVKDIVDEVERYCKQAKIKPATLGLRALNNARFFQRLLRRREQDQRTLEALRAYMQENPPDASEDAA